MRNPRFKEARAFERLRKTKVSNWLRYGLVAALVGIGALSLGCHRKIVSRTVIAGTVNGAAFQGRIEATIDTARGGSSTCVFDQLPAGFTPGTLSSHT